MCIRDRSYGEAQGERELREALCKYITEHRNADVYKRQVNRVVEHGQCIRENRIKQTAVL